jgi:hypothetical protein
VIFNKPLYNAQHQLFGFMKTCFQYLTKSFYNCINALLTFLRSSPQVAIQFENSRKISRIKKYDFIVSRIPTNPSLILFTFTLSFMVLDTTVINCRAKNTISLENLYVGNFPMRRLPFADNFPMHKTFLFLFCNNNCIAVGHYTFIGFLFKGVFLH